MTRVRFEHGDAPILDLTGEGPAPVDLALVGPRARTAVVVTQRHGSWHARVPLTASRWGAPALPLPGGRYRLLAGTGADGVARPFAVGRREREVLGPLAASVEGATVTISAPLDALYVSAEGQAALERRYATRPEGHVDRGAVFFESFYARTTGDNPGAIDRELARRVPDLTRYWSVEDLSVPVPAGGTPVVVGSPQWWSARGRAGLLVVNDWLRHRFSRRAGQHVLQTWHGTPLKRLALHRSGFAPRRALASVRESHRWDVLLAQNPFSARTLRTAYAFYGRPIWVEGYPRNDVLATGEGSAVRRVLGIGDDRRVILYAPTWRDDRPGLVDHLDAARLARDLSAVVLVRGHSRTLGEGVDASGPGVIDVTTYPDVTELMLAADMLVTDYSSVMFDFAVTGRPMYFYVPDLEHYRSVLRGFAFDLVDHAPGPVVHTQEALTEAIAAGRDVPQAYAAWQARFTAREDGRASERVVARILDQGLVRR